jgi:steroid delta-isomerase-like uncharacterized protein
MPTEANKTIVRRVIEAWNTLDWDAFEALLAPGYVHHAAHTDLDLEGFRCGAAYLSAAFANFEYTLVHVLAEGDLVAAYLRVSATHHGEFMGVPATGRALEAVVAYHARINDGRIVEDWDVWPFQVFLSQIGAEVRAAGQV